MIEFIGFGCIASSVLLMQHVFKSDPVPGKISRYFRNGGIAVKERNTKGEVTGIRFPKYKGKKAKNWGVEYTYTLPIGITYKMISEGMDEVFEAMLNKDVETEELPHNQMKVTVYYERLPSLVKYETEWLEKCKGYKVVIGVDHKKMVFHDFDLIPHLIIGGMTRYGKSVVMKMLITQLVMRHQGVKFHLFDLKGGLAFNRFKKLPQVHSVARDEMESLLSLRRLRNEIKKRQLYFEAKGYEDIKEAWKAGEFFHRDIIIIDESSVLAPQSKSDQVRQECRSILEFIAQVAGGLGYNLIMCSQYPTGDILPRQVKQNSDARLSFRLPTSTASSVILDETGAEALPYGMKGRAIYKTDLKRMIQVPYMDNDMIDQLINPMKESGKDDDHNPPKTNQPGTPNPPHTEEAGPSQSLATTADSFFRY